MSANITLNEESSNSQRGDGSKQQGWLLSQLLRLPFINSDGKAFKVMIGIVVVGLLITAWLVFGGLFGVGESAPPLPPNGATQ